VFPCNFRIDVEVSNLLWLVADLLATQQTILTSRDVTNKSATSRQQVVVMEFGKKTRHNGLLSMPACYGLVTGLLVTQWGCHQLVMDLLWGSWCNVTVDFQTTFEDVLVCDLVLMALLTLLFLSLSTEHVVFFVCVTCPCSFWTNCHVNLFVNNYNNNNKNNNNNNNNNNGCFPVYSISSWSVTYSR